MTCGMFWYTAIISAHISTVYFVRVLASHLATVSSFCASDGYGTLRTLLIPSFEFLLITLFLEAAVVADDWHVNLFVHIRLLNAISSLMYFRAGAKQEVFVIKTLFPVLKLTSTLWTDYCDYTFSGGKNLQECVLMKLLWAVNCELLTGTRMSFLGERYTGLTRIK